MASIDRPATGVLFEQLRALAERLWRPIAAQRPAVRWGLALAVFLALAAASYWGAGNLSPSGLRFLASSKRFSSDDVIKVGRALEKQRIAYRIDDLRRVEVMADQFDQAAELVAKLDLGLRSFDDIRDDAGSASLWDGQDVREQKEKLRLERLLERMIIDQPGVLSVVVSVNRPRAPAFARNNTKPSAFVYVETDGGHALPSRSVQAILTVLDGNIPGLAPESITVMDHRGLRYLDPGNPALGDHSRNRAREEEITEQILEKLDWIKGVCVQVQVLSPHADELVAMSGGEGAAAAKGAGPGDARGALGRVHIRSIDENPSGSDPVMAANRPLSIEPAGEQSPAPLPPPEAAITAATRPAAKSPSLRRVNETHNERGRVLVSVPRSFYINMAIPTDRGEPSQDDRRAMVERTEKQVRMSVALLLPDADSWKVDFGMITDDLALSRPAVLPGATDSRHRILEWGMVGTLAAGLSVLAIAGSWIHLARRPARLPELSTRSQRFHAGSSLQPSPSERVRELIQRNPEAAASVLQRWVGQGGRSA
jgi:flagellar M-ring protein FliF